MARYIFTRVIEGLITLYALVTAVFFLARLIGNPVDSLLGADATVEDKLELMHRLGLDRPLYEQYATYMWGLLHGNLGDSLKFGRPVTELFFQYFPNTVALTIVALIIAIVIGFALGMLSATRRGKIVDHLSQAISVLGMSAPSFWIGLMLIILFAVYLGILPVARMEGPASYVLPAFSLSFVTLAGTARLVRSSMIDVLDTEYVKLARIKGVSPTAIVWKHCLRNALLPVLTFAGLQIATLLNGSLVIESVFAWPGVGRLIYQGITSRDYPLVQGSLLIVGFIVILINLLVDISYSYVDPRIRTVSG